MMAKFEKDYFVGGTMSNYTDYQKRRYPALCKDLIGECGILKTDWILDVGCATGALLWEFKKEGYPNIKGMDESVWAIMKGRQMFGLGNMIEHYNRNLYSEQEWDWIFFLDVLEHFDDDEIEKVMFILKHNQPKKGIIVRIPVCAEEGQDYVLDVSERDKTHIQRHTKWWWEDLFYHAGFKLYKPIVTSNIYDSEGVFCAWFKKKNG